MISIWELANPQLREITVYQPGKPIEETARELGLDSGAIIKLASNENPLGPSPKAMEAMRDALETGHLYPDGGGFCLCNAVAAKLGLRPENVILGNGSNEVLEFLGHAFLNPGDDVITSQSRVFRLQVDRDLVWRAGDRSVQPGLSAGLGRNAGRGHTENPAHFRPKPK